MLLYPAIDLRGGRVVRLTEGRFDQETTYATDPLAVARDYAAAGATWLHVVDLDGAKDPARRQTALIEQLAHHSGLRVQAGGGIRHAAQVEALLAAGAERVVIGSLAVMEPALVHRWFATYGYARFTLALDVRIDAEGIARTVAAGWQEVTNFTLHEVLDDFLEAHAVHVLCTDISRDGKLTGPNTLLYWNLVERYPTLQIQASGGVGSLADLRNLRAANAAGAIIGRALYEKKFTLAEALAC